MQNEWVSRAINLHQILCEAWTFLCRNYSDDSEGCGYGLLVIGSFIMITCQLSMPSLSRAEFFGEISNHPGNSVPLQPRFSALWLLAFPKTKITFERDEISDCWWDSGKYDRAADGDWKNCVKSKVPTLMVTEASLSQRMRNIETCIMFLMSSSINVSIFHITWLDSFWTVLVYLHMSASS